MCRKCKAQPANEHRYVGSGRVICNHCEYIATPAGRERGLRLNKATSAVNTQFLRDYKKSHPCVDCGESDWRCLDFDHVRGKKNFNLSDASSHKLDTVKAEVAKCEVRCANCHRKRHYREPPRSRG